MAQRPNTALGSAVVGYVRAATADDPKLDEGERLIREYAAARGLNLVEVVREVVAIVTTHKPLLEQIIRSLADGTYVGVIMADESQLGRPPSMVARYLARIAATGGWFTTTSSEL